MMAPHFARPRSFTVPRSLFAAVAVALFSLTAFAQTNPVDPLSTLRRAQDDMEAQRRIQEIRDAEAAANQAKPAEIGMDEKISAEQAALQASALTDEQVRAATIRGALYLLNRLAALDPNNPTLESSEQREWNGFAGDQTVGCIALAMTAVLHAGRVTNDPRFRPSTKALEPLTRWLASAKTDRTYSAALQAQALASLPARDEFRKALARVVGQIAAGTSTDGSYGYELQSGPRLNHYWDNSNTQYAVLGMWSAAETGLETPLPFWRAADAHWRITQGPAGEWAYLSVGTNFKTAPNPRTAPRHTLTVAGVATLFVTQDQLNANSLTLDKAQLAAIDRGLARVATDFREHQKSMANDLYYDYGIERVGVASGRKYLGDINWFRHGAAALLRSQKRDGSWNYSTDLVGTSYALLFLTSGGSPVLFNKLQHNGDWNNYPRDDANLTRWIGKNAERPFNWQSISLDANPVDWLDAPILYIAGSQDPQFTEQDLEKLRQYIQSGGIIFSVAQKNSDAFNLAIRAAVPKVTGNKTLRPLPADHPLFSAYEKLPAAPEMLAAGNGVREFWIHSPADLSLTWQSYAVAMKAPWILGMNLATYATGYTTPIGRINTPYVPLVPTPTDQRVTLVRLDYNDDFDPEPGAWPRLSRILRRDLHLALDLQTVVPANLNAAQTPIAHMTGSAKFTLNADSIAAIRKFLADGGTLIADAAGGYGSGDEFATSFQQLAKVLAPDSATELLPPADPLFSEAKPGTSALQTIEYRRYTPANRRNDNHPQIWAWSLKGRHAILFSPIDLTSGLLGTNTWAINGYTPDASRKLATNLLLHLSRPPTPPAATDRAVDPAPNP